MRTCGAAAHTKKTTDTSPGARLATIVRDRHEPQEARDGAAAQLIVMWGPKEAVHASRDVTMYDLEVVAVYGSEPYKTQAAELIHHWMY